MTIRKQYFLLCPACLTLQDTWHEESSHVEDTRFKINTGTGHYEPINIVQKDYNFISSYCENCGRKFEQKLNNFLIAIDPKGLKIIPLGFFWLRHRELLWKNRNKILDQFAKYIE